MTPNLRVSVPPTATELTAGFARVRDKLELPQDFPGEVVAQAESVATRRPGGEHADETGIEFLTIDPPGSMDLDQAMHIARRGDGFTVHYAIADPGFFVDDGSLLDTEAQARGQTLYSPDLRTPLYPPVLSEGAASLLPDQTRPSVLWRMELDAQGVLTGTVVRRAIVRSRTRLTYEEAETDRGGHESVTLLREVGALRQTIERARGGISLDVPEQEVIAANGSYHLQYRTPLPIEDCNAQISLLTGMAAARLMLDAGVGLLRTLPNPDPKSIEALRRTAVALGVDWPQSQSYQDFIRTLDRAKPTHAALLTVSTTLLRGAGYVAFDGTPPEHAEHSAIAAPYAHATAPLRRLADRYVSEVCVAVCGGVDVPAWVRRTLPELPAVMSASDRRARSLDRAVLDYVEAAVLSAHVGSAFDAVVTDVDDDGGIAQIAEPAVRARVKGKLPLGDTIRVRLDAADPAAGTVEFAVV
ncbi:MAG: RNB domain-containing ribonuclease [Mycobacteriales bacterium]